MQKPGQGAGKIVTIDVAKLPIQGVEGTPWVLRCARVEPGGDGVQHHFDP